MGGKLLRGVPKSHLLVSKTRFCKKEVHKDNFAPSETIPTHCSFDGRHQILLL